MNPSRTLLRPVAALAGLHADRQVRRFLSAHSRTASVQAQLLDRLVRLHADTAFGRDHGFAKIGNWKDFRSAVPIADYERLRPYVDRVLTGETTALLPPGESPAMFSMTSGTTGTPKHIPVTEQFAAEMRRGWNVWGLRALRDHKRAWLRPLLRIASAAREHESPSGVPCGAISGMLAERQMGIVRRMYVGPAKLANVSDADVKLYALLRYGAGRDVALVITANPSTTIRLAETLDAHAERLIDDIQAGTFHPPGDDATMAGLARHARFRPNPKLANRLRDAWRTNRTLRPADLWNLEMLGNWTGGTLSLYLPRLRELYGDVPVRDIGLLASEGRLSVPLSDETPAGVAEITGNLLEFIPAEDRDAHPPTAVLAHETQVGQEYFLVVTNYAALWRYNLDDRVRVVDKLGDSPVIEFLCRGRSTANVTGEKLTERQVVDAMASAAGSHPVPQRFIVQPRFGDTPYYELQMEPVDGTDPARLAESLDNALCKLNIEYASKRKSRRLGPVRAVELAPGTLARAEQDAIAQRNGRAEQYKHAYLRRDVLPPIR